MFLLGIQLQNFRCFTDFSLSFQNQQGEPRKWTVLLGNNGVGKSALLKGIALITAGSDAIAELIGEPDQWVRNGCDSCTLSATISTAKSEVREVTLSIQRGDGISDILKRNDKSLSRLDAAIAHAERNYLTVGYGSSRQLNYGESKSTRGNWSRAANVATLFDPSTSLVPFETWAMDLDYRLKDGGEIVHRALSRFLRGASFDHIDKKNRCLMFKTPDGLVPMRALSDGYQNIAAWVGDLLYRVTESFENYKNPLSARGLLLIDEVDLHLHPEWQKVLIEFLEERLPNFQLVVTTHSPITAQQAGVGELHHLDRDRGRIKLTVFDGDPRQLLLHQLVTSELFGLESDESEKVSSNKERYRQLRDKGDRTEQEAREFSKLSSELGQLTAQSRGNSIVGDEQLALMEKINEHLSRS